MVYFPGWQLWNEVHRYKCKGCGVVVEMESRMNSGFPPTCLNGCKWDEPSVSEVRLGDPPCAGKVVPGEGVKE